MDGQDIEWRIWTDPAGLSWADAGEVHPGVSAAVADCASTLSPIGEPPRLSTYWIDLLLDRIGSVSGAEAAEIAHGNLWVLTIEGDLVAVRMDVDPPWSDPLEVLTLDDLKAGLLALKEEVILRQKIGHQLERRHWSQMNPAAPPSSSPAAGDEPG